MGNPGRRGSAIALQAGWPRAVASRTVGMPRFSSAGGHQRGLHADPGVAQRQHGGVRRQGDDLLRQARSAHLDDSAGNRVKTSSSRTCRTVRIASRGSCSANGTTARACRCRSEAGAHHPAVQGEGRDLQAIHPRFPGGRADRMSPSFYSAAVAARNRAARASHDCASVRNQSSSLRCFSTSSATRNASTAAGSPQ